MTENVMHSSSQPRWGTNPIVVSIAHEVLRACRPDNLAAIEVDPFSEDEFNQTIRAERVLDGTKGRDGFADRWIATDLCPRADHILAGYPMSQAPSHGPEGNHTALVNPPGSEDGLNVKRAWKLLDTYHGIEWVDSAVWVSFSLNSLQTLQGESIRHPLDPAFTGCRCVPSSRVPFVAHSSQPKTKVDKNGREVEVVDAPSHPMWFMLLPHWAPSVNAEQREIFRRLCAARGWAVF